MTDPIRVAMIIQAYYPHIGGAEKQLGQLAPWLKKQGVDLCILTRRYPGLASSETIGGVAVHRLPIPGPKPIASLSFTVTALQRLRKLRPQIIHAHELLSPTTTAVAAKRLFGAPVVAKVLGGGEFGDISKLKNRRTGKRRIDLFRRYVDIFIAVSNEIAAELDDIGIPPEQCRFLPNGVDIDRYSPVSTERKQQLRLQLGFPEGPTALYSGRLAPEKGVDQLIEAWPAIREHHPSATLVVLGSGESELELKQKASSDVRFLGSVDDVVPYLQASDVFILPSKREGLSNALLEAMSCGLPAIATEVGGTPDVVRHQQNGWLVPPDSPALLAESTNELFENPTIRKQLGSAARETIVESYGLPSVAERLRAVYDDVLSRS